MLVGHMDTYTLFWTFLFIVGSVAVGRLLRWLWRQ